MRRVEVNFSDQAFRTLEETAAARGMTMSETLRQALALLSWFYESRRQGSRVLIERPNGSVREVLPFDG